MPASRVNLPSTIALGESVLFERSRLPTGRYRRHTIRRRKVRRRPRPDPSSNAAVRETTFSVILPTVFSRWISDGRSECSVDSNSIASYAGLRVAPTTSSGWRADMPARTSAAPTDFKPPTSTRCRALSMPRGSSKVDTFTGCSAAAPTPTTPLANCRPT